MAAKALIYAVALFVLSQAVLSADATFDGWLYSGQSIVMEGRTFIIYESSSRLDILADYGEGQLFITNNSCQQTGNVRICLDNVVYDLNVKKDKMEVRAISLAPDMLITRTADDNEFEAGDGTVISVTIKNSGGLAQNLTYTDVFPESVDIVSVDGARKLPHSVVWTANSMKTKSVSFSYKIKVNEVMDRKFVATLDYFDGVRMKTVRSTTMGIKTTPRLLHEFVYGGGAAVIGEEKNITLNFTNKETSTARISVDLFVDSGLVLTKLPRDFKRAGENQYHAEIEVFKSPANKTYNKTQHYYFEFIGIKTGTFKIKAVSNYSTNDIADRKLPDLERAIAVSEKGVNVRTNLQDLEFESNQAHTLRIWLQNLNTDASIKNVLVKMDGGGFVSLPDVYIAGIAPTAHNKILEKTFYAPEVSSSKGYTIEANVSYETQFGDNFSKRFVFTETVNKVENMTVTHTISETSIESGKEATVKVKVKNPRTTKISNIAVKDNISDEFGIIGVKNAAIQLGANDEQTAYTYIIKAPRVSAEKDYHINTTVSYSDADAAQSYHAPKQYAVTKSTTIRVKPQKFELTATRTIDSGSIYVGDFFDETYTIKNPSTDTVAENIKLVLPVQPEFDLADAKRSVSLGRLGPGEEMSVTDRVKRRANKVGNNILEKTRVTYMNQFGEAFEVNVSSATVSVSDKQNSETFVSITKEVVAKANNTDSFEVVFNVTNKGKKIMSIFVEDGNFRKDLALNNGSSIILSHSQRIDTPGKYLLEPATATYEFRERELIAGSNSPQIEIVNNPLVALEKVAPSTADTSDNFEVELKAKPLTGKIKNLTIHDGEKKIHYDEISNETSYKYKMRLRKAGTETLDEATATYIYEGVLYETKSNAPSVTAVERQLVSLSKSVSVNESKAGERIEVYVKVKNIANDEISVILSDEGNTWEFTLAPGEEKTVSYKLGAQELGAATASYTYKGEEKGSVSSVPSFRIIAEENGKVIKEDKGMIRGILDRLLGILTWKRD